MSEVGSADRKLAPLDPRLFRQALIAINAKIETVGAEPLYMKDEWGVLEDAPVEIDPNAKIGKQCTIEGTQNGVSHRIHLRMFNESASMGPYGLLADIRIYAAPGDDPDPEAKDYIEGQGGIVGLVWLSLDYSALADLGHGTEISNDETTQRQLEALIAAFGLPPQTIAENSQQFDYDNAALAKLIEGIPSLGG
ncbi:MAG TPA: hypothetical protein VLG37_00925 [Candidatus Saccharimonadales bacterium]|nr:hypothetical protein [Candidatus Saccharimonadales bacterium]